MSFTATVDAINGGFTATLVGAPVISVVAPTRDEAIAALSEEIERRIASGQIVEIELPKISPLALAGKYADDPWLEEICEEAYRARAAEPRE